ncbi:holo-ACP synthase [Bacterioplanes sanyensis]|uniref:Holo-[acyl-carrier-protein] synthase n=1 Tax=Bacterioplanes sanyensis TaxID=1249553 RepID=A0A222FL04_9GAMM|nr:holo-ACP synthase [Bacterioplanes sanyensis]ASP39204.1 holo-ACP synthase [Bacterioplanes sanyensis]
MRELESLPAIVGVGTDLLDARRMEQAWQRRGERLIERFLTPPEQALWHQRQRSMNFVAKQFAAKEALAKALGTGIAKGVGFQQLQILRDQAGAPLVSLSGAAQQRLESLGGRTAWVSLSDDGSWVQAFAVLSR